MPSKPLVQVTKAEYAQIGSEAMTAKLAAQLRDQGHKPYVIPVGGSNTLGCWGYLTAFAEMVAQTESQPRYTHIVMVQCLLRLASLYLVLCETLVGTPLQLLSQAVPHCMPVRPY